MLFAYWGFLLLSVHAGTHLDAPFNKMRRKNKTAWITAIVVLGLASVYGCYAFVKRGIADYLFGRIAFVFFDFRESRVVFLLDYLAIMILCAFMGMWIVIGLSKLTGYIGRSRA